MNPTFQKLGIKELNPEMISPNTRNYKDKESNGSKIVIIGMPGSGKSTALSALLYAKKHIIPVAEVFSGTEDVNGFYQKSFPSTFVHNSYSEEQLKKFIKRQKLAKEHLENPWSALILDDVTDDPSVFRKPLQQNLFKLGRHYNMLYFLILQYALDIRPAIRSTIDGTLIFRDANIKNRRTLYENFCGIIGDFSLFCSLMDQLTDDYCALYVNNRSKSNDFRDCIYWYKATPPPPDFKFGCQDYWEFHKQRYNPEYVEPY